MWRNLHVHRNSSLYLPLGSVNLVLKVMGTPDEISSPPGWNRVSPGWPRNFNTELTEPTKQIKTTFPMNVCKVIYTYQKRPICMKRDLHKGKETCTYEKRLTKIQRYLNMWKETYIHMKTDMKWLGLRRKGSRRV